MLKPLLVSIGLTFAAPTIAVSQVPLGDVLSLALGLAEMQSDPASRQQVDALGQEISRIIDFLGDQENLSSLLDERLEVASLREYLRTISGANFRLDQCLSIDTSCIESGALEVDQIAVRIVSEVNAERVSPLLVSLLLYTRAIHLGALARANLGDAIHTRAQMYKSVMSGWVSPNNPYSTASQINAMYGEINLAVGGLFSAERSDYIARVSFIDFATGFLSDNGASLVRAVALSASGNAATDPILYWEQQPGAYQGFAVAELTGCVVAYRQNLIFGNRSFSAFQELMSYIGNSRNRYRWPQPDDEVDIVLVGTMVHLRPEDESVYIGVDAGEISKSNRSLAGIEYVPFSTKIEGVGHSHFNASFIVEGDLDSVSFSPGLKWSGYDEGSIIGLLNLHQPGGVGSPCVPINNGVYEFNIGDDVNPTFLPLGQTLTRALRRIWELEEASFALEFALG